MLGGLGGRLQRAQHLAPGARGVRSAYGNDPYATTACRRLRGDLLDERLALRSRVGFGPVDSRPEQLDELEVG